MWQVWSTIENNFLTAVQLLQTYHCSSRLSFFLPPPTGSGGDLDSSLNSEIRVPWCMSPCILSWCLCLFFVLHFELILQLPKLPTVSLSPCLFMTLKLAGIINKILLKICCWGLPCILPVITGCVDNEISYEKDYANVLLPWSYSSHSIPSISRQLSSVPLCLLQL